MILFYMLVIALLAFRTKACDYQLFPLQHSMCGVIKDTSRSLVNPVHLYETRASPGKGLGVFATADISPGTPILIERPLFHVPMPQLIEGKGYMMTEMMAGITREFQNLPPIQQEEFLSLHEYRFPTEDNPNKLMTIFRSNAYNTGDDRVGMFPKIARINHSCAPNAGNHWSKKRNHRVIYSTTDIWKGEEITVSYIPLLKSNIERHARLQQYGFTCTCDACQSRDGGKIRVEIQELLTLLKTKLQPSSKILSPGVHNRRIAKATSLVKMIQDEGLMEYLAEANHIAAVLYERSGNLGHARVFARQRQVLLEWAEEDSDESHEAAEYIRRLEKLQEDE